MQFIVIGRDGTDEKALAEEWVDNEAYVKGNVWESIEIKEAAVAPFWAPK